ARCGPPEAVDRQRAETIRGNWPSNRPGPRAEHCQGQRRTSLASFPAFPAAIGDCDNLSPAWLPEYSSRSPASLKPWLHSSSQNGETNKVQDQARPRSIAATGERTGSALSLGRGRCPRLSAQTRASSAPKSKISEE